MKTVLVRLSEQGRDILKLKAESSGLSIAEVADKVLAGESTESDLGKLSGQVKMMFDLLVDMDSKLDSPKIFSESSKEVSGQIQDETNETYEEKDARLKRERIEQLRSQEYFRQNPWMEPQ